MRQHGHTLGRAVVLDAAAHIHARLRGHLALSFGHGDFGHGHTVHLQGLYPHLQSGRGARRHHARQTSQRQVVGMQARGLPIVLHPEPQLATLSVGQAHQGLDQLSIRQALAVAFEFDGEGFGVWNQVMPLGIDANRGNSADTGR